MDPNAIALDDDGVVDDRWRASATVGAGARDDDDAWRRARRAAAERHRDATLALRERRAADEAARAAVEATWAREALARAVRRAKGGWTPRLREPRRGEARRAVARVRDRTLAESGEVGYAPSFAKVRRAVEAVWGEMTADERAVTVTEYVMLHLGGSKHRAKCFEDEPPEEKGEVDDDAVPVEAVDDVQDDGASVGRKRERGEVETPMTTVRVARGNRDEDARRSDDGEGITVRVEDEYDWEGRLRTPKMAKSEVVSDVVERFVPWWENVDSRDPRAVGRWGEALVYHYLLATFPARENNVVEWLNADEETNCFYDIKVTDIKTGLVTFVEVKSTRFDDKNAFEISPWEWDFATKPSVNYHIYRVYNAGDKSRVRMQIIRDPAKLVREHKVSMALVV